MRVCVLTLACLAACGGATETDGGALDAGRGVDAADIDGAVLDIDAVPSTDAFARPDRWSRDASYEDYLCTGAPPATGIPCVPQDPRTHAGCGGEGRIVFYGTRCAIATGEECGPLRGAFASLEECAANCVAAGECAPLNIFRYEEGREPDFSTNCTEEPWTCAYIGYRWPTDPSRCAVFGAFGPGYRDGSGSTPTDPWPHPEEWEIMRMISLMPWDGNIITCIEPMP